MSGWSSIHTYFAPQLNPIQPLFAEWIKKIFWFLIPKPSKTQSATDYELIENMIDKTVNTAFQRHLEECLTLNTPTNTSIREQLTQLINNRLDTIDEARSTDDPTHHNDLILIAKILTDMVKCLESIQNQLRSINALVNELESKSSTI
jgi:hypothetical protein